MDSQLEDLSNFTSLLRQGADVLLGTSPLREQPLANSDFLECASNKKRGSNFNTDEDNLLVSSWLNNSLDAANGHNKKSSSFWTKIQSYYTKWKNSDWPPRSVSSLCHRWSNIQKSINRFCSCLARIESLHKSDVSNEDNIQDARKMFNSIEKQPFRFDYCWDLLKNEQKWLDREATIVSYKRKSNMPTNVPTLVSREAVDDDPVSSNEIGNERPAGRKTAKESKKLRKSLLGDSSSLSSALSELKADKKKAHDEKMLSNALSIQSTTDQRCEMLEIQKAQLLEAKEGNRIKCEKLNAQLLEAKEENRIKSEKLKFLQSKEDMKIMMKDTSTMTPEQKEYFKMRRIEIQRRNSLLQ